MILGVQNTFMCYIYLHAFPNQTAANGYLKTIRRRIIIPDRYCGNIIFIVRFQWREKYTRKNVLFRRLQISVLDTF